MKAGFITAGISGILLTLGFAPYEQSWLGWAALIPIAWFLSWKPVSTGEAFKLGLFFGLIHFLTSLSWLTNVTWTGWIVLSIYLSLYPALWTTFWRWLLTRRKNFSPADNLIASFYGACGWVVLEWCRSWMLTGFPWNFLAVTQHANLAIIQLAEWGGIYLISWLLAFFNLAIALSIRQWNREIRQIQP